MIELTSKIKSQFPNLNISTEELDDLLEKYEINTVNRVAGFFAQCAHESGNFKTKVENLNYSAGALDSVFPKYFKNAGVDANAYARQPEKIANRVYANRMGNGDEASGDGWKFRGRGFIQLTGKTNYTNFAESVGKDIDSIIDYLAQDDGALESALYYWKSRGINSDCDADNIESMTRKVNGGTNGLEDRKAKYEKFKGVLA